MCYRGPTGHGLSDTRVIRRTNQPLSATNDAETIDDEAGWPAGWLAAAGHNKLGR